MPFVPCAGNYGKFNCTLLRKRLPSPIGLSCRAAVALVSLSPCMLFFLPSADIYVAAVSAPAACKYLINTSSNELTANHVFWRCWFALVFGDVLPPESDQVLDRRMCLSHSVLAIANTLIPVPA